MPNKYLPFYGDSLVERPFLRKLKMNTFQDCRIMDSSSRDSTPGKVEVLQDLDLYYIKQLAHSYKEYDLEQRIALEIKIREGTTNLLSACGGRGVQSSQPHTLEAAKSLLTSNERMAAYMAELQQRRTSRRLLHERLEPALARVCISDLRMPLLWKDIEHFKNKGDIRKFCVFVLLKIGTEIYDTVMVNPVDRSMTDICFDDIIIFNGISSGFECRFEVYSYLFDSEFSMNSIPRKIRKSLHSSISRTVGRKLAASLQDDLPNQIGPKFDLVATAKLNLDHISENISIYDLQIENNENQHSLLPLFGHFCCRLVAQPDCFTHPKISGYAKVPESEFTEVTYCRVLGWRLEVWESRKESDISPHHPLSVSIDLGTEFKQLSKTSIQVINRQGMDRGHITLLFDHPDEATHWIRTLEQHSLDHERWSKATEIQMEIPQPTRHSFVMPKRSKTSLYEETPLGGRSPPSSQKSSYTDISSTSVINSFSTPCSLPLKNHSFTLATRSSFRRWGSVRANMPFFKTKKLETGEFKF